MSKVVRVLNKDEGEREFALVTIGEESVLLSRYVSTDNNGATASGGWFTTDEIPYQHAEAILTFFKEQSQ